MGKACVAYMAGEQVHGNRLLTRRFAGWAVDIAHSVPRRQQQRAAGEVVAALNPWMRQYITPRRVRTAFQRLARSFADSLQRLPRNEAVEEVAMFLVALGLGFPVEAVEQAAVGQ